MSALDLYFEVEKCQYAVSLIYLVEYLSLCGFCSNNTRFFDYSTLKHIDSCYEHYIL